MACCHAPAQRLLTAVVCRRDPKLEQIGFEVVEPTPGCCECESLSTKGKRCSAGLQLLD